MDRPPFSTASLRPFLLSAALACATQLAAAQGPFIAGQLSPQSQATDVVPFEVENGLIVVKALVGDGLVSSAIIDNGISMCLMTPDYAIKRGVKASGTRDVAALDRTYPALNIAPQAVRINRMLFASVPCGILDLSSKLSSAPPKEAPPVWIGNSALAAVSYTIDPVNRQILFRPPGAPLPPGATVVPFELKDGRIWVDVKVNGKKNFSALVDTGSVGTMLPAKLAKDLSLSPAATYPVTHPDGKEGKVCAVDLTDLAMAGLKVTDVQAIYVGEGSKDGFDPDLGIIGNDVLLRYRVTIDCAQKKMAFEKISQPKTDTIAVDRSGQRQAQPQPAAGPTRVLGAGGPKITPAPARPGGQ